MAEKDLISLEAALDEVRDIWCRDCHCATTKRDCKACNVGDFMNRLRDLPAVDAVPVVHGRWERFGNSCRCPLCGDIEAFLHNYCPHCGARMDGKVNSDRGEKHCIVDGTTVKITNEPFVIEGGFVVDVGKEADNARE